MTTMVGETRDPSTVASVTRTIEILRVLRDTGGGRITELAKALELPKSSVHRHLKTLEKGGFVIKRGNNYYLGLRFLYYGNAARERWDPEGIIRKSVRYVAEETTERAQFMVWEHDTVVYLYRELGERAVQTDTSVGKSMPVHATSGGKAILACLPEAKCSAFLDDAKLEAYTDNTITNEEALLDELQEIRREEIALNREEYIDGLYAVSVPVQIPGGEVIGSIGVSGPTHRLKRQVLENGLPDLLLGIANEIELKYGHNELFDPPVDPPL